MCRIQVSARHEAVWDLLRRRVRAAVLQQLRQNVGVGTFGTSTMRRRNRLEHLNPTEAADKYAMRAVRHDDAHRWIARFEHISPDNRAKGANNRRIGHANASINVQRPEAKIKQDSSSVAVPQRCGIWTEFRQHAALVHDTICFVQTQRNAMAPAFTRDAL